MQNKKQKLTALLLSVGLIGTASATPAAFDSSAFEGTLTTGVGSAATIAGTMAAVAAGVMAWRKIAKYFNKAG